MSWAARMLALMEPDSNEPQVLEVTPVTTAVISGVVEMTRIGEFFDASFTTLGEVLGAQGVVMAGPPVALYHSPPGEVVDLEVGIPIDGTLEPQRGVEVSGLPGGRVARLIHEGPYDGLGSAWERLGAWVGEQGLTPAGAAWEAYLTEPGPDADPSEMRTELNLSVS